MHASWDLLFIMVSFEAQFQMWTGHIISNRPCDLKASARSFEKGLSKNRFFYRKKKETKEQKNCRYFNYFFKKYPQSIKHQLLIAFQTVTSFSPSNLRSSNFKLFWLINFDRKQKVRRIIHRSEKASVLPPPYHVAAYCTYLYSYIFPPWRASV